MRKYIFLHKKGTLNDITKQDSSFLDCKHKHMTKSGAPPNKVGVLYRLLLVELHSFTSRINSKRYHSLVLGLISMFLEMVWVPLNKAVLKITLFEVSMGRSKRYEGAWVTRVRVREKVVLLHHFLFKVYVNYAKSIPRFMTAEQI